jgi:hypothetical protein
MNNRLLIGSIVALLAALLVVGVILVVNTWPPHKQTDEERRLESYQKASDAASKAATDAYRGSAEQAKFEEGVEAERRRQQGR